MFSLNSEIEDCSSHSPPLMQVLRKKAVPLANLDFQGLGGQALR
jgi:hypothetical protein